MKKVDVEDDSSSKVVQKKPKKKVTIKVSRFKSEEDGVKHHTVSKTNKEAAEDYAPVAARSRTLGA